MLSGDVRFSNERMIVSHLFCLLLQIHRAKSCGIYLAEEHRVKPARSSAFPRTITVLYAAGESLTVCWLPSVCAHIFQLVLHILDRHIWPLATVLSVHIFSFFAQLISRCITKHTVHP